ncbi:MAG: hypothetical protein PHQ76_06380 [Caldisericia bacterium]|nr:hypothetical protein [Caldisericia bacterium]
MSKYIVEASKINYKGKNIKKGKKIDLDDNDKVVKELVKIEAIKPYVEPKKEAKPKEPEKKA